MSKIKINLEEIIKPYRKYLVEGIDGYKNISGNGMFVGDVLAAMKEACKQTLELASENFEIEYLGGNSDINDFRINKQSILDTINQVE